MLTVAVCFFGAGILFGIWLSTFFDSTDEKKTKKYDPFGHIHNSKGGVNLGPPGPRPKQTPMPQGSTY